MHGTYFLEGVVVVFVVWLCLCVLIEAYRRYTVDEGESA